jgi:hypothetical protein
MEAGLLVPPGRDSGAPCWPARSRWPTSATGVHTRRVEKHDTDGIGVVARRSLIGTRGRFGASAAARYGPGFRQSRGMHPMSEYACRRNLPSDLDQRRHVALARDVGLGRIGRIATLTEPWVRTFGVGPRLASSGRGNEHGLIERADAAWWRGRVGSVGGGRGAAA